MEVRAVGGRGFEEHRAIGMEGCEGEMEWGGFGGERQREDGDVERMGRK